MSEEMTRRGFLAAGAATGVAVAAAGTNGVAKPATDEKLTDGGLAPVTEPGIPERKSHLVPPGAVSQARFRATCVGCQLCVAACPEKVLRPAAGKGRLLQIEMGFDHGYCRPECVACGAACPAGAILPVTRERKAHIHLGHAIWHVDRCLAAQEGVKCNACERHCPAKAITMVQPADNPKGPKVPVVDTLLCLGCGACEYLCPARPLPGMTIKGFERHREVVRMGSDEAVAEAARLIAGGRASCILVKDGVMVASGRGSGVKPLLELFDRHPKEMRGAILVDKVIGRAAASIALCGGVKRVSADVVSEGAKKFLEARKVACAAQHVVPQIVNRAKTGECPMEETVKALDDPKKMVEALRAKLKTRGVAPDEGKNISNVKTTKGK